MDSRACWISARDLFLDVAQPPSASHFRSKLCHRRMSSVAWSGRVLRRGRARRGRRRRFRLGLALGLRLSLAAGFGSDLAGPFRATCPTTWVQSWPLPPTTLAPASSRRFGLGEQNGLRPRHGDKARGTANRIVIACPLARPVSRRRGRGGRLRRRADRDLRGAPQASAPVSGGHVFGHLGRFGPTAGFAGPAGFVAGDSGGFAGVRSPGDDGCGARRSSSSWSLSTSSLPKSLLEALLDLIPVRIRRIELEAAVSWLVSDSQRRHRGVRQVLGVFLVVIVDRFANIRDFLLLPEHGLHRNAAGEVDVEQPRAADVRRRRGPAP